MRAYLDLNVAFRQFVASATGSSMHYPEKRARNAQQALQFARRMLVEGYYEGSRQACLVGRALAQTASEAVDFSLVEVQALFASGNTLAPAKLKQIIENVDGLSRRQLTQLVQIQSKAAMPFNS